MTHLGTEMETHGYAIARGLFSGAILFQLEAEFDRIVAQLLASGEHINARWAGDAMDALKAEETVVLHTHNVQYYSAIWAQALFNTEFLAATEEVLGPDIVLHHTKLFQKPAENGAPFPMHQDWSYFPSRQDSMIAAVIHVSDATDDMGCLRVIPGSHKLGRLDQSSGATLENAERFPLDEAVALEAKAGDVVFFHYLTVHGSKPNTSGQIRKTVLVQMHAGDDVIENPTGHPYDKWVLSGFNTAMTRGLANS